MFLVVSGESLRYQEVAGMLRRFQRPFSRFQGNLGGARDVSRGPLRLRRRQMVLGTL